MWSAELVSEGCNKYHFEDDFTALTGAYGTDAGHCCYKVSGQMRTCAENTYNTLYTKPESCYANISDMRDYGAYEQDPEYKSAAGLYSKSAPAAACHQCITIPGEGPLKIYWYPACREVFDTDGSLLRKYSETPKDNGLEYKPGENCCLVGKNDGENVYDRLQGIQIYSRKLGNRSNSQTCYWLSGKCAISLVDDGYCAGELCDIIDCPTNEFPYYNDGNGTSTIPAHSEAYAATINDRCIKQTEGCVRGPVYYNDFKCDTQSHVKNTAQTACVCNDNANGKGYYNEKVNCEKATYNTHKCYLDEGKSDCYIKGGCNEDKGYYDDARKDACLASYAGAHHTCAYNENVGCWEDGKCDTSEHYYNDETTCKQADVNKGHVCGKIGDCWYKGACDSEHGYYDAPTGCPTGVTCVEDQSTGCYVTGDCDESQKYYKKPEVCEQKNTGHECKEVLIGTITCFIPKEECKADEGYYATKSPYTNAVVFANQVNGCYPALSCQKNYFDLRNAVDMERSQYVMFHDNNFSWPLQTVNGNKIECYQFENCKYTLTTPNAGQTALNANVFSYDSFTAYEDAAGQQSKTCYYPTGGCQSGYQKDACDSDMTDTPYELAGITCHRCCEKVVARDEANCKTVALTTNCGETTYESACTGEEVCNNGTCGCPEGYFKNKSGTCVAATCENKGADAFAFVLATRGEGTCSSATYDSDCSTCADYNVLSPSGTLSCHEISDKSCSALTCEEQPIVLGQNAPECIVSNCTKGFLCRRNLTKVGLGGSCDSDKTLVSVVSSSGKTCGTCCASSVTVSSSGGGGGGTLTSCETSDYNDLKNRASYGANSYFDCCSALGCRVAANGDGISVNGMTVYPGSFADGQIGSIRTEDSVTSLRSNKERYELCVSMLTDLKNEVAAWNAECPSKQIDDEIATWRCGQYLNTNNVMYTVATNQDGWDCRH